MGASYDEDFTPKASVLVCRQVVEGHEKLRHAHHWNVPTVTAEWLWDSITSGELKPFAPYLAQPYSERPFPVAQKRAVGQSEIKSEHNTEVCEYERPGQDTRTHAEDKVESPTTGIVRNDNEAVSRDNPIEHKKNPAQPSPSKSILPKPPPLCKKSLLTPHLQNLQKHPHLNPT